MDFPQYSTDLQSEEVEQILPSWVGSARTFVDLTFREAEEFNALLDRHVPSGVERWDCDQSGWTFEFDDALLEVLNSEMHPIQVRVSSWSLPRSFLDPLRRTLRRDLSRSMEDAYDIMDLAMILLRLTEEVDITLHDWKHAMSEKSGDTIEISGLSIGRYNMNNLHGTSMETIQQTAEPLLGISIKKICETIPSTFRILHIEPVFRADLVSRFKSQQQNIYDELTRQPYSVLRQCVGPTDVSPGSYRDNVEGLAEELSQPTFTFQ